MKGWDKLEKQPKTAYFCDSTNLFSSIFSPVSCFCTIFLLQQSFTWWVGVGGGNDNKQLSSWLLLPRDMRPGCLHYTEGLYNYILIHSCFGPDKRILSISFCLIHTIINQMCPPPPQTPPSASLGFWGTAADRLGVPRGG